MPTALQGAIDAFSALAKPKTMLKKSARAVAEEEVVDTEEVVGDPLLALLRKRGNVLQHLLSLSFLRWVHV